jgi:hypothetical protein
MLTERFVIVVIWCVILLLQGCATTKADFKADIVTTDYAADGSVAAVTQDKTSFVQRNGVTWGSKLTEGAGEMAYIWKPDGEGSMAVGNVAKDMQAGDANELLLQIFKAAMGAGGILAPKPVTPVTPTLRDQLFSALLTDTELRNEVMDFIRNLAGGGQIVRPKPLLAVPR